MQTTKDFYEAAKAAVGCRSDYAFAKLYGLTRSAVSQYANGKSTFDDERAELIAEILKIEPGYVMACARAERTKSEKSRSTWARVAKILAASTQTGRTKAETTKAPASHNNHSICIMSNQLRNLFKPRQHLAFA